MHSSEQPIASILVAAKFGKPLSYKNETGLSLTTGQIVRVPLGNRTVSGIVLGAEKNPGEFKLKAIDSVLDNCFDLSTDLIKLITWSARYYHAPLGQVLAAALPKSLLSGKPVQSRTNPSWRANAPEDSPSKPTPKQQHLLDWLIGKKQATTEEILAAGFGRHLLNVLRDKNFIIADAQNQQPPPSLLAEQPLAPNKQQAEALVEIAKNTGVFVLQGVTGSGKTEVYMQAMESSLKSGKQVLFLVPEIGLVPQTLARVKARFNLPVLGYHSATSESKKIACWQQVRSQQPLIIVGTRSAIFLPFSSLALTIIDEEQDLSYKQQESFRYNARDLAIVRNNDLNGKVILGSATPSLETVHNSKRGQYHLLTLDQRAESRSMPQWQFTKSFDSSNSQPISAEILHAINAEITAGHQVLIYLNRRGYAPRVQCSNCGWQALCASCDSAMTLHQKPAALICHRCDRREAITSRCPHCASSKLEARGLGTEQLESFISATFPNTPCIRIDRDSTQRKDALSNKLAQLNQENAAILIGTQMITKGHHLPGISLVVALSADHALFSHDYRALEHLSQTLTQVAGRAGRGHATGKIIVETAEPEHPLLRMLPSDSYTKITEELLNKRQRSELPPFTNAAVLHANCVDLKLLISFMNHCTNALQHKQLYLVGPIPSAIERKNNRYRYQTQIYCPSRATLHQALSQMEFQIGNMRGFNKIRWGIDVDPLTMD